MWVSLLSVKDSVKVGAYVRVHKDNQVESRIIYLSAFGLIISVGCRETYFAWQDTAVIEVWVDPESETMILSNNEVSQFTNESMQLFDGTEDKFQLEQRITLLSSRLFYTLKSHGILLKTLQQLKKMQAQLLVASTKSEYRALLFDILRIIQDLKLPESGE